MTLQKFENCLKESGIPVAHYEILQTNPPYIVYQELSTTYKYASGQPVEESTSIEVVHFTKKAFDPSLERLKEVLIKNKIGFTIAHAFNPGEKTIVNQFDLTISKDMGFDE